MDKIRVYLVDDHQLFIDLFTERLLMEENIEIAGTASAANAALEEIGALRPHIVLLDISMPDMSGIELAKLIKKFSPLTKIIGVSMYTQLAYIKSLINNGAMGYVTKSSPLEEILTAIKQVHQGHKYLCESVKKELAENALFEVAEDTPSRVKQLTMREIDVLKLVRSGKSSQEIANELYVSPKTVEVHRHNILKKLNVKNTIELIFVTNNQIF